MAQTDASMLQEAYLDRYRPDRFLDFYASIQNELHLLANPGRIIPVSPVPILLDRRYEEVFSTLTNLLWRAVGAETFRQRSAAHIPDPLRTVSDRPGPPIPFDRDRNIGCVDLHLLDGMPRLIEFMVLPPGMVGIYPGLLARYGEFFEEVLPGCSPRIFLDGENRESCEALLQEHIVGSGGVERFAIVDWEPHRQITYGEFQYVAEGMEKKWGVQGLIADPRELVWKQDRVWLRGLPVDRILNRLTLVDWLAHGDLLREYTRIFKEFPQGFVYHPHLWYLGDKASLTLLSDSSLLGEMKISDEDRQALAELVPATVLLPDFLDAKKGLVDVTKLLDRMGGGPGEIVLKPLSSHASKGVVYGPEDTPTVEKLRAVLRGIDPHEHVAMKLVPPPEIPVPRGSGERELWRSDIRLFVLNGRCLFAGGRIYLGNYTNQTPCRAFAPLFFV